VTITASTTTPVVGRTVQFGLRSTDDRDPAGATWDFGDGTGDSGTVSGHAWGTAGTYRVTADIVFADGTRGAATPLEVTVTPLPAVRIVASDDKPVVGEKVDLRLDASGGTPRAATWAFGDGEGSSALGPAHAWAAPGDYTVTAEATFADGTRVTAEPRAVTVTQPTPGPPRQLSPADGTVFDDVPRTTTLTWETAPGAIHYEVETEYQDPGTTVWTAGASDHNVSGTSWTFEFVGAQKGRWRVAAADADGRVRWSGWWGFEYTR
jgi:PKD repeat protein